MDTKINEGKSSIHLNSSEVGDYHLENEHFFKFWKRRKWKIHSFKFKVAAAVRNFDFK